MVVSFLTGHAPVKKHLNIMGLFASHKSNPSSVPQGYVEMITVVEGVP
jgi:hypothetical protein